MPAIDDCCALNVCGETASISAYSAFRLITVNGDQARNHGPLPRRGASKLLIAGERAALIGGYGPEYDLITPMQITPAGVLPHGPERRLVQPDGLGYRAPPASSAAAPTSTSSRETPRRGTASA
jgi:hypothetical protein